MYNELKTTELFKDLSHTLAAELLGKAEYPWQILDELKSFIVETGKKLSKEEYDEIGENIWVAKDVSIAKTASITGPAIIGSGTEIRPSAFIRGSVIIGCNCVIGNSTELKNAVIFDNVQVPHFNYVGDSVLGFKSHMGAGSVTSNVKSDKTLVTIKYKDEKIETGRKKLGAILGDFVEVGCNSVLNPGTVIGSHSNVYPLSSVRGYVPCNSIFKAGRGITEKREEL